MLVGCGRRVADPCLAPAPARKRGLPVRTGGERSPAIDDRGSVAPMRKSFAARQRHLAKALPQVLASSSNFAQASAVDAAYVSFGAGGSEPLTIAWCLRFRSSAAERARRSVLKSGCRMHERVVDGTDLATAMLDVPSQLAKRLDSMNGPPERRRRDRRYERLMLVDNWR